MTVKIKRHKGIDWHCIGPHRLACCDNMKAMAGLPHGLISAVITDPPYGVNYKNSEWDKDVPPLDWLALSQTLAETVMFTPGNGSQYKYPEPVWTLSWSRPGSVQRSYGGGFSHWEPILVYGKNLMEVDCKVFVPSTERKKNGHPCPKPVAVMEWLVKPCGDVILDPFMGSGTTGIACVNLKRKFIGIELNPDYFQIALREIQEAMDKLSGTLQIDTPRDTLGIATKRKRKVKS